MQYRVTHQQKWYDAEKSYLDTLDEVREHIKKEIESSTAIPKLSLCNFNVELVEEVDVYDLMKDFA